MTFTNKSGASFTLSLTRLDTYMEEQHRTLLTLVNEELQAVGTVCLHSRSKDRVLKVADITRLFVAPAWRGAGVASFLVVECCKLAAEAGCEAMALSIALNNRAVHTFYKRLGFSLQYEFEDGELIMTRPLGDPAVDHGFVTAMAEELRDNNHKGKWDQWLPTTREAEHELVHHVTKLSLAIADSTLPHVVRCAAVQEYAADVANHAMKLWQINLCPFPTADTAGIVPAL